MYNFKFLKLILLNSFLILSSLFLFDNPEKKGREFISKCDYYDSSYDIIEIKENKNFYFIVADSQNYVSYYGFINDTTPTGSLIKKSGLSLTSYRGKNN